MWDFCSKTWLHFWNVKSGGQRFAEASLCVSRAWGGPSDFGDASENFILTDRSTPCHSSDAHCLASVRSPHINLPDSRDQKTFSEFCLHPSVVPGWGKKSRSGLTSAATNWTVSPDWHVKALAPHVAVWEPFRRWGKLNEPWAWSPDPKALVLCRKRGSLSAPYTDIVKRRRLHPREPHWEPNLLVCLVCRALAPRVLSGGRADWDPSSPRVFCRFPWAGPSSAPVKAGSSHSVQLPFILPRCPHSRWLSVFGPFY